MKPVHWLFSVSVALFVSGLAFVVISAGAQRKSPPPQPAAVELTPVASVKQIMTAIVDPAANVVFDSVSTTIEAGRIEEKMPRTDAEWDAVAASAAALVESGNLLLLGDRRIDRDEWTVQSQRLMAAGNAAIQATVARNAAQLFEAGGTLYESCDGCHRRYKRGS
jgi:hypothetical protein